MKLDFDYIFDVIVDGFKVILVGSYKFNMDKILIIMYIIDFNYEILFKKDDNKLFKNIVELLWKDINGNDKNSKFYDRFNFDGYIKGNGFKYGFYNV